MKPPEKVDMVFVVLWWAIVLLVLGLILAFLLGGLTP